MSYYEAEARRAGTKARPRIPRRPAKGAKVRFSDYLEGDNSQNVVDWLWDHKLNPEQSVRNRHAPIPSQAFVEKRDDSLIAEVGIPRIPGHQQPEYEAYPETSRNKKNDKKPAVRDPSIHVYRSSEAGNNDIVTIHHLEWELEPDLDDELEEYSRLARLGQFRTAQEYFDRQLAQHAVHPLIFVRYAETLWEMGEFKSVVSLAGRAAQVFPSPSGWSKQHTRLFRERGSKLDVLRDLYLNWKLLYWISLTLSQNDCEIVYKEITEPWLQFPIVRDPTSTQLANLYLFDCLRHLLPQLPSKAPWPLSAENIYWLDWGQTYELLKRQGRVWDFRTMLLTHVWHMIEYKGGIPSLNIFFDVQGPADFCQRIRDDWLAVSSTDISIQLALIEIFSQITLKTVNHCTVPELATVALRHADSLSEHLLQQQPDLANTYPLLLWLFARASVAHRLSRKPDDGVQQNTVANMAGAYFESMLPGAYTPYYIPVVSENPGWTLPDMPLHLRQTLQMISKAAQGQHNWRLKVACLSELIFGSADPGQLLQELSEIQRTKQGELYMYTISCLSRYLLATSESARKALRDDLANLGCWKNLHLLSSALVAVVAARDVVLSALTPSDIQAHGSSINAALQYYSILPSWFQDKIEEVVPDYSKTISSMAYWNQYMPYHSGYPTPYYYTDPRHQQQHGSALSEDEIKRPTDNASRLRELSLKKREIQLRRFQESEARIRGDAEGSSGEGAGSVELSDIEHEIIKLKNKLEEESGSEWETEEERDLDYGGPLMIVRRKSLSVSDLSDTSSVYLSE